MLVYDILYVYYILTHCVCISSFIFPIKIISVISVIDYKLHQHRCFIAWNWYVYVISVLALHWPSVSSTLLRLRFKFRRGSLPPIMPLEFVGCIGGCDETLREVLDLKYLRAGAGNGGGERGGDPHPPARRPPRAEPQRASVSNPRPSLAPAAPSWVPQPRAAPVGSSSTADTNSDVIVCNCGQDALLLTVRKDGANQGRQFYKCNAGSCNFFLWADQPSQQGGSPPSRGPQPPAPRPSQAPSLGFRNAPGGGRAQGGGGADRHSGQIMCNCNEAAVTRTVQKDGPNKGRMFHTCGKPREQQCGFFQWADENVPPAGKSHAHTHLFSFACSPRVCRGQLTTPANARGPSHWTVDLWLPTVPQNFCLVIYINPLRGVKTKMLLVKNRYNKTGCIKEYSPLRLQ